MDVQPLPVTEARPKPPIREVDFSQNPFIVIWEVTRACDLACVHCRADAVLRRHPDELTTEEAFRLIDDIRRFGRPLFVLTGGDPLKRPDCFDLIRYGNDVGLRVALTPSGTPLMTCEVVQRMKDSGLARLAVSLDGSTEQRHDAFRKVAGSFRWTLEALRHAREIGLPIQINTTVTRFNLDDLEGLARLMDEIGIVLWSVFFLIVTGRGQERDDLTPQEYEHVFNFLYDLSRRVAYDIKTTSAPHYRRVVLQRTRKEQGADAPSFFGGPGYVTSDGIGRGKGVNDGNGFVFISHTGEVFPSGFLPVSGGNVRRQSLATIYRESPVFRLLRDYDQIKGKCGICEYKGVCGGSRARAYAFTGDIMESDPSCVYIPRGELFAPLA